MVVYENEVVGKTIVEVSQNENGLHFRLEDGWSFSLFNEVEILNCGKAIDSANLLGERIREVTESKKSVIFVIGENISLVMSMLDEAYTGPESMNVWAPDGRIFVSQ